MTRNQKDLSVLAADAAQLINNPAHREAMERLERELVKRITTTEFDGSKQAERYREKLNLVLYCHGKYKKILASMVATGDLEAADIERKTLFRKGL